MKIFKNSIFGLVWVVLHLTFVFPLHAQEKGNFAYTVHGVVKDASLKKKLPGISISLPGIASAMTDDQGSFSIKLPSKEVVLEVTGPGYSAKSISVRGRDSIQIELYGDEFKSAFGKIVTPKGDLSPIDNTNAWSAIKENTLLSTAATADALLQGRVAGMNVIYRSGTPGNGSNIFFRGLNSFNADSQPLVVVDGMPYENSAYSSSLIDLYLK